MLHLASLFVEMLLLATTATLYLLYYPYIFVVHVRLIFRLTIFNLFLLISETFFFSFVFSINSILIIVVLSLCTFDFLVFNCVQHRTKSYQIRHIDFSSKTNWMERWKRTATKKKRQHSRFAQGEQQLQRSHHMHTNENFFPVDFFPLLS